MPANGMPTSRLLSRWDTAGRKDNIGVKVVLSIRVPHEG
jgi:hypothetical protein